MVDSKENDKSDVGVKRLSHNDDNMAKNGRGVNGRGRIN